MAEEEEGEEEKEEKETNIEDREGGTRKGDGDRGRTGRRRKR